jgi:cytochrome c553
MQLATRGGPGGIAACASCHGEQGEGNAGAGFPRIAGQPTGYLVRQLASYADGSRNNAIMGPIAKALTSPQREQVAEYYAALSAPAMKQLQPQPKKEAERGKQLATAGDERAGVQSCANCHGPGGIGLAPNFPYLAGQHASYLVATMRDWKSDARNTDPSKQMPMIAKRLSDADTAAVAGWFAAQPPPGPASAPAGRRGATPGRTTPAAPR